MMIMMIMIFLREIGQSNTATKCTLTFSLRGSAGSR